MNHFLNQQKKVKFDIKIFKIIVEDFKTRNERNRKDIQDNAIKK